MIVRMDKSIQRDSTIPNRNWYENEPDNLVIDETTEEGQALADKIVQLAPYMDLVIVDGKLVDVTPTERPPQPPSEPSEIDRLKEEIVFLRNRDSQMQDDISSIIEGLTGGV